MPIGKLSNAKLEEIVLSAYRKKNPEVLVTSRIGIDCSAIDFGDQICFVSSDPITAASKHIGRLAVHVNCNDAAAAGARPIGILTTILLPTSCNESDIQAIIIDIAETAKKLDVDVLGGHTEYTSAVTRPIISGTVLAKRRNGKMINAAQLKPGMDLIMSKWCAIEGTMILAEMNAKELNPVLSKKEIELVESWEDSISVVPEGLLSSDFGVEAMHDITEGGILGAVWEMAEASQCGVSIDREKIHICEATQKLCDYYKIDPLRLISSGSMLIGSNRGNELVELLDQHGIFARVIGRVNKQFDITCNGEIVSPPEADELIRVFHP